MLENVLEGKNALFETGMQTVLRGQENRYRRIVVQNGNVVQNARSEQNGLSANVYKNGVNGFASIAGYTGAAAEQVLKAATENAQYLNKYTRNKKAALPDYRTGWITSKGVILDIEQKKLVDMCNGHVVYPRFALYVVIGME